MPLCLLRVSLSGFLTASDQGSLTTTGEFFNVSALDPLLPTFLIATLCLCVLSVITYYSLVIAWEVFWASRRSPSPLDPSAEVVLTPLLKLVSLQSSPVVSEDPTTSTTSILIPPVRTTSVEGSSGEGLRRDAQNTSQAMTRE